MKAETWEQLAADGGTFTCYSSALAAWSAASGGSWPDELRTGLHLLLTEEPGDLFGFSPFPPSLAAKIGLARHSAGDAGTAVASIRGELEADGRVIVSGDGFNLPWHVACGRRHVPHWFTLVAGPDGPELIDPFECRTELGWQRPTRQALSWPDLEALVAGLPGDDAVLALREAFALGADDRPLSGEGYAWVGAGAAGTATTPGGIAGPQALQRLARHFQEHGAQLDAYRQADDLWSIARHRAFLARHPGAGATAAVEHLASLAARWAHVAPLLMQARLAVEAGRSPSSSLPDALIELGERESAAARALADC